MASIDKKIIHFSKGKRSNFGKVRNMAVGIPTFIDSFRVPMPTPETFAEYLKTPVQEQIRLKAVAGYFFRTQVVGNRRTRDSGKPSDIVTLDFDSATPEFITMILQGLVLFGTKFFIHSTRRHTDDAPRIRMVIFLKKPVDNDTYGAVSRILAYQVDPEMTMIDLVSFRSAQMMFMPTISSDMEYLFYESDGENLFDWEAMLSDFEKENGDWRDLDNLPKLPGEILRKVSDKAEVPEDKEGPVGDFCRAYNVIEAIEAFDLPYEPVSEFSTKPRYTYTGGTTRNGAIIEDDGSFLTSYHGSDPVGGRTVNSWDLVIAHKFPDLEAQEDPETPMGQRKSWKAMLELIKDDKKYLHSVMKSNYDMKAMFDDLDDESLGITQIEEGDDDPRQSSSPKAPRAVRKTTGNDNIPGDGQLDKEALDLLGDDTQLDDEATDLLGSLPETPYSKTIVRVLPPPDEDWFASLEWSGSQIDNGLSNQLIILQNDKRIRGCMEWNEFLQQVVTRKSLKTKLKTIPRVPIVDPVSGDRWTDTMTTYVRAVLESPNGPQKPGYGIKASDRDINGAIDGSAKRFPFHPIKDMIESRVWDGMKRAEMLFIKYLGLADTPYHRAVCRIWLLAAVVRIYEPGHKFDFVPILEGAQGIRKSTFIKTLAMGFAGNLTASFHDDKKLIEQILGHWIMELPELGNMSRSGVEDMKAFISMESTTVRMSYGRRAEEYKRQCVFMGSTNKEEYLIDTTGNRRFWPIKVNVAQIDTVGLASEIGQVWAEVLVWYHDIRKAQPHGELPLYLSNAEEQSEALSNQESRQQDDDADVWAGKIEDFLNTPYKATPNGKIWHFREMTCFPQLFEEALEMGNRTRNRTEYAHMTRALGIAGWVRSEGSNRFPEYGKQKSFVRKFPLSQHDKDQLIKDHIKSELFVPRDDDDDDDDGYESLL